MKTTRIIQLPSGVDRASAPNKGTMVLDRVATPRADRSVARAPFEFESLFIRHFDLIRDTCHGFSFSGIGVVAFDPLGEFAGRMQLAASHDLVKTAIVGRHGHADLYLEGARSISLRHFTVILEPTAAGALSFRVLNLRSGTGFADEDGRALDALVSDGPAFIRCSDYAFFILPIVSTAESRTHWLDSPEATWQALPKREFLSETQPPLHTGQPSRFEDQPEWTGRGRRAGSTVIVAIRGPLITHRRMVEDGEVPLGEFHIKTSVGTRTIVVGKTAARAGILIGRSQRCDTHCLRVLADPAISRVHLLLILIDETLCAIDTASSNGTWIEGEEIRAAAVVYGTTIVIPRGVEITWRALH